MKIGIKKEKWKRGNAKGKWGVKSEEFYESRRMSIRKVEDRRVVVQLEEKRITKRQKQVQGQEQGQGTGIMKSRNNSLYARIQMPWLPQYLRRRWKIQMRKLQKREPILAEGRREEA